MIRKVLLGFLGLAILAVAGVDGWYELVYIPPRHSAAAPEALAALSSTPEVDVSVDGWIVMRPRAADPTTGFIFYPGGEVDPEGYSEPLQRIAAAGYLVVDVPMPLDLAILAPDRAEAVIAAFPEIKHWVIGGHSLGGSMAARYVARHPDANRIDGLLLWDAYAGAEDDLSASKLPVCQLHRLEPDGRIPAKYVETRVLLPANAEVIALAGASHINYGRFVPAKRFREAPPATIPIDQQHHQIADASIAFLARVSADSPP